MRIRVPGDLSSTLSSLSSESYFSLSEIDPSILSSSNMPADQVNSGTVDVDMESGIGHDVVHNLSSVELSEIRRLINNRTN